MITLVLGGARSGKSRYALSLCQRSGVEEVVFIATATAVDDEMAERIERHRSERPRHWSTIEAPLELCAALEQTPAGARVLVDCVTLWIANLMEVHRESTGREREKAILEAVIRFVEKARERERDVVVVSNDVGHGLVPETSVGREFRDLQGRANQLVAARADRVVLVVAGIPLSVK